MNCEKKSNAYVWGVPAILVLLIAASAAWAGLKKTAELEVLGKKAAPVEVLTLKTREYQEKLSLPARIEAEEIFAVSSETGGLLDKWLVPEGALVREGQVIAEMEKDFLLSQKEQLRLGIEAQEVALSITNEELGLALAAEDPAESSLRLARSEADRANDLLRRGSSTQAQLDRAENTLKQTELGRISAGTQKAIAQKRIMLQEAQLAAERARLAELELRLAKADVRAPATGVLDRRLIREGELAQPGTRLVMLYKNEGMRAKVNVPDRQVPFLVDPGNEVIIRYIDFQAPGAKLVVSAKLVIPGLPRLSGGFKEGIELPASIVRVAAASSEASNTFEVELSVANPGMALRHGMLGRVEISLLSYPEAIVIPLSSVQVAETGPRVFVAVGKEGRFQSEMREIEPAGIDGGELFVSKGLAPGERLIVSGQRGLVHGDPVSVVCEDGRYADEGSPAMAK